MKMYLSGIIKFFEAALLIAFLYFVFQVLNNTSLRPNTTDTLSSSKRTSLSYPPPQESIIPPKTETTDNPYPAPGESVNVTQTSDCSKMGAWIEYVNKKADFTFEYPAEAELIESVDDNGYPNITLYLKPYCYDKKWWGPKQVDIVVLMNSDKLSLEEFVIKQYSFDTTTDSSAISRELASISTVVTVDKTSALQIKGTITRETPRVYIPYNDLVIFVGLTDTSNMPSYEEACPAILDLYNKILSSVKFLDN